MQIMAAADAGRFSDCLQAAAQMKAARISPDTSVYNALISPAARQRSWLFAWAMFDDMLKVGIHPTPAIFAHLIHVTLPPAYFHQPAISMCVLLFILWILIDDRY